MGCKICGKDSGKGKTCGSTCRSKLARSVASTVASTSVTPRVARPDNDKALTVEDIVRMPLAEANQILQDWRDGKGTEYQQVLGQLDAAYSPWPTAWAPVA